jgi:Flp pilus assembly protein TadD
MRVLTLLLFSLAACSTHPEATSRTAAPGLRAADAALVAGAPGAALHVAQGLLQEDPGNIGAMIMQGDALSAMGRTDEAVATFTTVLSKSPDSVPALLGVGRARLLGGNAPAAIEALDRAIAINHDDARALNDLGIARDLQGNHDEAQLAYRAALAAAPEMDAAQVNLGLSLALGGNPHAALGILQRMAADPGVSSRVRHDLAAAMVMAGDASGAERVLKADMPPEQVPIAIAAFREFRH